MKRGDIYWLDLDPTLGHEQSGFRPVVIVSATAFNLASKLPVVVPITNGGAFAERLGFARFIKRCRLKNNRDYSMRSTSHSRYCTTPWKIYRSLTRKPT